MQPTQARVIPIGQTFALLDHMLRKIHRVKALYTLYEIPRNIAGATANIKNAPRFPVYEAS